MKQKTRLISELELLELAKKVVYRYAHTIPAAERDDVVMSLVENYLKQEQKINSRFNNQSKASTYVIAILNRMCCGVIRKELKHWQMDHEDHHAYIHQGGDSNATAYHTILEDEINYLNKVLILLNNKAKTMVFLAFYYLFKAKLKFVAQYDQNYTKNKTLSLLATEEKLSKGIIFERLSTLVNKVENHNIKADAVRMWLNKTLDTIIIRLNGPFDRAQYNKDSFQVLFEYLYEKE